MRPESCSMTKIGCRIVSLRLCEQKVPPALHVLYFLPLWRAAGRDGAARRDHPSQGHSSSPAALNQMPRCVADSRDSIVPRQFSFSPDFDAELPAVLAPQSASYHPKQLHISTSLELLAYPWRSCASTRTGSLQESNQKANDRADSPHCVCRHGATVCMHLWAGIASMSASVAASQAPGS